MFARSALVRILGNSYGTYGTICNFGITWNTNQCIVKTLGSFAFLQSRLYSEDNKNKGSVDAVNLHEKGSKEDEGTLELFDAEEEQNKLSSRNDLSKYKVFKDEDSPIIFDVEEERLIAQSATNISSEKADEFDEIYLERGVRGVFDVEELACILRDQNASDIVAIELPQNLGYADHMVIVTGKSARHLLAMATHVRRLFKNKKHPNDKIPDIEGKAKKNEDWFALDLGNIILHLFSQKTRRVYDLESLWALGPEFDPQLNQDEDPLLAIISKHSLYLGDLEPADTNRKG